MRHLMAVVFVALLSFQANAQASQANEASEQSIHVKTLTGDTYSFTVNLAYTVRDVKLILQGAMKEREKKYIPPSMQRLILKGKLLEDNKKLLDYGAKDGEIFHLVPRIRSGQ
jgi:uncharacterized ubiquitin-like protein YukD